MNKIVNCKQCGKIFNYDGSKVCPKCRREEADNFQKVKDYLYKNPGSSTQEVSEETEVPVAKIIEYLRQGKLEVKGDGNMILECERCGVPISSGRFCNKCVKDMQDTLSGAAKSMSSNIKKPEKKKQKSVAELMRTQHRKK